jgi:hypothetical protein
MPDWLETPGPGDAPPTTQDLVDMYAFMKTQTHRPARLPMRTIAVLALLLVSACSFGLYDEDGSASPGQWWPWVCPDAGDALAPEAGCFPTSSDGSTDAHKDGGS